MSWRILSPSPSPSSSSSAASAASSSLLLRHSFVLPARPTANGGLRLCPSFCVGGAERERVSSVVAGPLRSRKTHRVSAGPALAAALSSGEIAEVAPSGFSRGSLAPALPPALFITVEALESENDEDDDDDDDEEENHPLHLSPSPSSFSASASLPLRSLLRAPKSRARDPSKRALSTSAPLARRSCREKRGGGVGGFGEGARAGRLALDPGASEGRGEGGAGPGSEV